MFGSKFVIDTTLWYC